MPRRSGKHRLKGIEQHRQEQETDQRGDDRPAGQHGAKRADHTDGRNKADAQRRAEQHQSAGDDGGVGGIGRDQGRLLSVVPGAREFVSRG